MISIRYLLILVALFITLAGCMPESTGSMPQLTLPSTPKPEQEPEPQLPSQPPPRTVAPPPAIDYFLATPDRIGSGDATTLSWHVSGATTVYLDQAIGNVAMTGTIKVYPKLSTTYTIIARNESSSVSSRAMVIVVPAKVGLPVINSFAADPGSISTGSTAVLNWNISNAASVDIDPGVGTVEAVGTVSVAPTKTTVYTLTAYNKVGFVVATTQILVTKTSSRGQPDLVVTALNQVETDTGIRIAYTIENRGAHDSPSSITRLYANGVYQALDTLGMVPAGWSMTRTISGWLYNPATSVVKISVDADNNVIESNEANNVKEVSYPVETRFDFIDTAKSATWGVEYPYKQVIFGELPAEREGVMLYKPGRRMEDTSTPIRMLETRPLAIYNGWIIGDYTTGLKVRPGDHFYGVVGLAEGAIAGEVQFWVYIRLHGQTDWVALVSAVDDIYDYRIKTVSVPIPPEYYGKDVDFSLRVFANGEPLQDWATWVDARILR